MKKKLSLHDHILVGYLLKTAHIATLKASTIFANKDGKNKPLFLDLKILNEELLRIRLSAEKKLYVENFPEVDEKLLRQRYLGTIDRKLKLMFRGKNIFS